MKLFKIAQRFAQDEEGAVTVDWVVLTAAVVGLVGIAMAGLRGNMSSVGDKMASNLRNMQIDTDF